MNFSKISYDTVGRFSKRDMAFINRDSELDKFVGTWVSLDAFDAQIQRKSTQAIDRVLLHKTLMEQYAKVATSDKVLANISLLKEKKSFTIVTAHQPSLMTGPLYYIFKICSTINLCKQLANKYPDYNFIPVFISGGEDHDLDEVNHFELYGKDVRWETTQTGSVGRMSTEGLQDVIDQCFDILSDTDHTNKLRQQLNDAIKRSETYGQFQFDLVNYLFKEYGLVFFNMDHGSLKRAFIPSLEKELFGGLSFDIINESISELESAGQKAQAAPREINVFYLKDNYRARIVKEGDQYQVIDQDLTFSESELKEELQAHPERFSPNVVMRPLYQETILPNLAYIGGGGEIAYWTERKTQFDAFGLPFPLLIRRNSAMIVSAGLQKQMVQLEFTVDEIFQEQHILEKAFVSKNPNVELDTSEEYSQIEAAFKSFAEKAKSIDPGLEKATLAEHAKVSKSLDHLANKLVKAEKRKHETALNKIAKVQEKLFPNNGLQERKENFLPYYAQYGNVIIDDLVEQLDPLDRRFVVVEL